MDTFNIIIAMLVAVMISGIVVRVFPFSVPIPFIQIGSGVLISTIFDRGIKIDPEIFFLIFLPPLLFLDGWKFPKIYAARESTTIFHLAIFLVLLTVVSIGYLIHWLIPSIPLPVAFALAAILSPTDPVALGSIARNIPVPRNIMAILQGEALFNDASSLVAFRFAVSAMVTGAFSLSDAVLSFIWLVASGITIGVIFTAVLMMTKGFFQRRFGIEPGSDLLISLILPFAVYLITESVKGSGILAAVTAGFCMSYVEMSGGLPADRRLNRQTIWEVVQFTLNGIMFVLLGEQIPSIISILSLAAEESGQQKNFYWIFFYGAVIYIGLLLIRLLWLYLSIKIRDFTARKQGKLQEIINIRLIIVMSIAGTRGSITLAGIMALPLTLLDGSIFPARELSICLAAIILLLSLVVASIFLPPLLQSIIRSSGESEAAERKLVQEAMFRAAKSGLENKCKSLTIDNPNDVELNTSIKEILLKILERQARINSADHSSVSFSTERIIEREMRLAAIESSRRAVYLLAKQHRISDTLAREQVTLLDHQEASLLRSRDF